MLNNYSLLNEFNQHISDNERDGELNRSTEKESYRNFILIYHFSFL